MSRSITPSAIGRSMPRRGTRTRYPGGIAAIVGTALPTSTVELGGAVLGEGEGDALGVVDDCTRKRAAAATNSRPSTRRSTPMLDALPMPTDPPTFRTRRDRAAELARARGLSAVLVTPGSDLTYLTGHRIHESERLTCLVLASDGAATLIAPELEVPRARVAAPGLEIRAWGETDDPLSLAAGLITAPGDVAVGDRTWAAFVLGLEERLAGRHFVSASPVITPLRMRKDEREIDAL